jgi:hypothetical protein
MTTNNKIFILIILNKNNNIKEFTNEILNLSYPKDKIVIYFMNKHKYDIIDKFSEYHYTYYSTKKTLNYCYNKSIELFQKEKCDYFLFINNNSRITNKNLIKELINQDVECVSPLLVRVNKWWSNFWGEINEEGFYKKSEDYEDIVLREKLGVFEAPYISSCILMKKNIFLKTFNFLHYNIENVYGNDMAFCYNMRKNNISMYVDNTVKYGYLEDENVYDVYKDHPHPELFDIDNEEYWENKYLHPQFLNFLRNEGNLDLMEILPYLYEFPFVTETFCDHIIDEMEFNGNWSGGGNMSAYDKRLGGEENHPTVDIHMNQIGFETQWKKILLKYIQKIIDITYPGTYTKGFNIAFVVKYELGNQEYLRPHHDASSYTVIISLNQYDKDFKGGGTLFIKEDYTHKTNKGYATIHPGRVTHYHAGKTVEEGKRYILVSFCEA